MYESSWLFATLFAIAWAASVPLDTLRNTPRDLWHALILADGWLRALVLSAGGRHGS